MLVGEIAAWRRKVLGPAAAAARRFFRTPDGAAVLEALDRAFSRDLAAVDREGRVDPSGTLVRVGNKEVVDYLRELAENDQEDGA